MYTEKSVGVDCTVVCLEVVPDGMLQRSSEAFQSFRVSRFPGFQKVLQSEVWEGGGTLERHREYRK